VEGPLALGNVPNVCSKHAPDQILAKHAVKAKTGRAAELVEPKEASCKAVAQCRAAAITWTRWGTGAARRDSGNGMNYGTMTMQPGATLHPPPTCCCRLPQNNWCLGGV
jgi:hypothetical protein